MFATILAFYLGANAGFACLYYFAGGVEGARPDSFLDAYFFSVQTMATIGYGRMVPVSVFANVIVTVEALFGLVGLALATGLMFAKFSQPRARVVFSKHAIIGVREGVPTLLIRLANERRTGLVEAQLRLVLVRDEVTRDGESVRRFYPVPLLRSSTAVFALSWTAVHTIDESSPLYGATPESLAAGLSDLVASLVGIDEVTAQAVHARYSWRHDDILFDHRFVDVFVRTPDGGRALDYSRFHDVERVAGDGA
jgi:inward rectifier potassium channel